MNSVVISQLRGLNIKFNIIEKMCASLTHHCKMALLGFCIQALRHTQSTRRSTLYARNRVTFTLLSVIIVFGLCITPDTIMTFIGLGYKDASYLARAVREITDFLLTINSGINIILYCTFNKAFRYGALFRPSIACRAGKSLNFQVFCLKFQKIFEFSKIKLEISKRSLNFQRNKQVVPLL